MECSSQDRFVVSELLAANPMALSLRGREREAVLVELVELVPGMAGQPEARQVLLKALLEREQLHSTGIGDGVALPHARNALGGVVSRPVVVFGRHLEGVVYAAVDGAPVRLFFLLLAPNVSQHLQLLARLSRILRDPVLRRNLLAAARPDQVLQLVREAEARM